MGLILILVMIFQVLCQRVRVIILSYLHLLILVIILLATILLFLTHLSSEITKGFANGDEKIASNLLADAIKKSAALRQDKTFYNYYFK